MTHEAASQAVETHDAAGTRRTGLLRLTIGLVQGILLWWLLRSSESGNDYARTSGVAPELSWPASDPVAFGAFFLVAALLPPVLLAGAGRMRPVALALWGLVAGVTLAIIGGWSGGNAIPPEWRASPEPQPLALFAAMAMLFVAHHLIQPALARRRWVAPYPDYYDVAWKAAVQLALSLGFVGAFWLVLFLGAALFSMIGLSFLQDLITKDWFAAPITTLTFATAVQLTDVRDGLIKGVRTVGLMLLGWLLPIMTVLAAAFLLALPFTGLDGLWEAGSGTGLMLSAAAALIILINAGYHDGDDPPAKALRLTMPVAAILLLPLVALAFWGVFQRIGQYGLTPERIIATACACVGLVYAVGYAWAAVHTWRRRDFMQPLERTNVVAAVTIVAAIIALFTPIADPERLSIADQLARLERGAVSPADFDYAFLKFDAGRQGERALKALTRSDNAEIARLAREADEANDRYELQPDSSRPTVVIGMWPQGTAAPPGLVDAINAATILGNCNSPDDCVARLIDLDGDGQAEALIANRFSIVFFTVEDGTWREAGAFQTNRCHSRTLGDTRDVLRSEGIRPTTPRWSSLEIGDGSDPMSASTACPTQGAPVATAGPDS